MDTKPKRKTGWHRVTPDLLALLETLHRYRYLRSSFLPELLPGGDDGIKKQLRRRRVQGYVSWPDEQFRGYNNLWCPKVYELTKKGEQTLIDHGRHPQRVTRLDRKPTVWPARNFAHSMMICDTLASIEIGLKDTGARFVPWTEIVPDGNDPLRLPYSFTYNGQTVSTALVPDGLFGIEYDNGHTSYFVLEAENGQPLTRSHFRSGSTLKKMLAYKDIITKKTYKQMGCSNLRVLFVFPSEVTAKHAAELAEEATGATEKLRFTNIPVQEMILKAPPPFPDLVTREWYTAGKERKQLIAADA